MKLENQVCSLDLAKKLKELGVKQESLLSWFAHGLSTPEKPHHFVYWSTTGDCKNDAGFGYEECATFTVAELGEILPWQRVFEGGVAKDLHCVRGYKTFQLYYELPPTIFDDTEANARAKMIVYLLENKLITLNSTPKQPQEDNSSQSI